MGYYLQALIGKHEDIDLVKNHFGIQKVQRLEQGLSFIPATEEVIDLIDISPGSAAIKGFIYLTPSFEKRLLKLISSRMLAYVEIEYFGGKGGQRGVIWQEGEKIREWEFDPDALNKVLQFFGVKAKENQDEFDTLEFSRYRSTEEWPGT